MNYILVIKIFAAIGLYSFLPLTALTYFYYRRHRRKEEVLRVIKIIREHSEQEDLHQLRPKTDPSPPTDPPDTSLNHDIGLVDKDNSKTSDTFDPMNPYDGMRIGSRFFWALSYVSIISVAGFAVFFFGHDIFPNGELLYFPDGNLRFPKEGSRLVGGIAFLGSYIWGLQHIFRRYVLSDITPSIYYGLGIRLIFSSTVTVLIFNAYEALAGGGSSNEGTLTAVIWPSLAFLLGMFPQHGILWLTNRMPILSAKQDKSVRDAPLEMIEGLEAHDTIRLEEMGLDTCYDLAMVDFIPLMLNTAYSARQLVDWILQAKLCMYFSQDIKKLREHGIQTIVDLLLVEDLEEIKAMAHKIPVSELALENTWKLAKADQEIRKLCVVGKSLGVFSRP